MAENGEEGVKTEVKAEEGENEAKGYGTVFNGEEITPIGKGVFGNIYDQFKGKVKEAFAFLRKHKSGDMLGVFHRDEIGDIDLVWGDKKGGLLHIISKHVGKGKSFENVDEMRERIDGIIRDGILDYVDGDKIVVPVVFVVLKTSSSKAHRAIRVDSDY